MDNTKLKYELELKRLVEILIQDQSCNDKQLLIDTMMQIEYIVSILKWQPQYNNECGFYFVE